MWKPRSGGGEGCTSGAPVSGRRRAAGGAQLLWHAHASKKGEGWDGDARGVGLVCEARSSLLGGLHIRDGIVLGKLVLGGLGLRE